MPEGLEKALRKQANKKGLTGQRKDAYVYGTLARIEKAKGKAKAAKKPAASGRKKRAAPAATGRKKKK